MEAKEAHKNLVFVTKVFPRCYKVALICPHCSSGVQMLEGLREWLADAREEGVVCHSTLRMVLQ